MAKLLIKENRVMATENSAKDQALFDFKPLFVN